MDPSNSAQDVIRCDLCEKEIATMYCDFCHVHLCISCVGKHISEDYDKHKVVPIEQRKSTLIYPKCTKHQTKSCEFYCKECNASVCSFCTTLSDAHERHTILTLFDIYNSKREVITKDKDKLENIISPTYQEIAAELEGQIDKLDGEYEKLITAVLNQGEEYHRKINIIMDKMKAEIKEIKVKHTGILKEHLYEIKTIQNLIKQTQAKLSEIEESNEVSKTTEYTSTNKELSKLPSKVFVPMPTFSPETIDIEELYKLIGSLSPLSTIIEENGYRLKKELLKEPELISMVNTEYGKLRSVTCHSDEEIWTSARNADITCLNIRGSILHTLKINSMSSDLALTRDGDLLYSDEKDKSVYEVKMGQIEEVIKLHNWSPINLCVTSSSNVLVSMYNDSETQSKVVCYAGSTVKQTIQFDNEGKPLYSGSAKIKYITENKNLDICVADSQSCAVVVVNQTGKYRFRYNGCSTGTKNKRFQPIGIATDSQSQILTTDRGNRCIHILNQDGQFLNYIDNCGLKGSYGLCVDKNDFLFVAEYHSGKIKKIQYLK